MMKSNILRLLLVAQTAMMMLGGMVEQLHGDFTIPAGVAMVDDGRSASGLNGMYFDLGKTQITSISDAVKLATNPTAHFTASKLDYNGRDNYTIKDFLASDGASLTSAKSNALDSTYFSLTGVLRVTKAGTYSFTQASDDGSILTIGGVRVMKDLDGLHTSKSETENVTFTKAGLYTIQDQYFNRFYQGGLGYANFSLTSTINGGNLSGALAPIATPEPSSYALMVLGLLCLAVGYGYRRRSPVFA